MTESPHPEFRLTPAEAAVHLAHVRAAADGFAILLAGGDLSAPVPSCPGWDLTRLAWHLGGVHRWARGAILEGHPDTPMPDGPSGAPALTAWYREGAEALTATLHETDPATPCWTFGPRPRTAAFWFRRQDHETAMHAWDAAASQAGARPVYGTGDPRQAADGVDEVAGFFFPRQVRLQRASPLECSLAVECTDTPGRWVLAGDGAGPESARDAEADATVRGPAAALVLLLWRRVGLDNAGSNTVSLDGSEAAARTVLDAGLTP